MHCTAEPRLLRRRSTPTYPIDQVSHQCPEQTKCEGVSSPSRGVVASKHVIWAIDEGEYVDPD